MDITQWIIRIPVLLFAVTIHEYSHGKAALSLGDPTARDAGRLTLNPLPHIDLLGALCLFLFRFGWAKPVPVDVRYFQNPRRDTIIMSLSGPVANLAAAFVAGLFFRYLMIPWELYLYVLIDMILINIGLGVFNLLPIPPLDGSHVLESLLPPRAALTYRRTGRYAPLVLIGALLLDHHAGLNILGRILWTPIRFLACLFGGPNLCGLFG